MVHYCGPMMVENSVGDAAGSGQVAEPDAMGQYERRELSEAELEAQGEAEAEAQPVSYRGTDFDVEGLVRRLARREIIIPTFGEVDMEDLETARFQRNFVWRKPQMDKFIESLLLEYPIPGIILVQQADKNYLVLDGQQRLRTLAAFYEGMHGEREFSLTNVADRFKGLTYRTLSKKQRLTLNNTFIQATIVQTDGSAESLDAVYQVFERLNSGGTQLTPHEIRIALYAGPLVDYLASLNATPTWRSLYGPRSPRLRDQELILRIIALYVTAASYKRPLKQFLNNFVSTHRDAVSLPVQRLYDLFVSATRLIQDGPGRGALRRQGTLVNAAMSEALVVGLMRRLELGPEPTPANVARAAEKLAADDELTPAVDRATADEESVRTRLAKATSAFASIK